MMQNCIINWTDALGHESHLMIQADPNDILNVMTKQGSMVKMAPVPDADLFNGPEDESKGTKSHGCGCHG